MCSPNLQLVRRCFGICAYTYIHLESRKWKSETLHATLGMFFVLVDRSPGFMHVKDIPDLALVAHQYEGETPFFLSDGSPDLEI